VKRPPRNVAASHRAKLLALARDRGEDFQFLLGRWIIERFLFRLAASRHNEVDPVFWTACLSGSAALKNGEKQCREPERPTRRA